MNRILIIEDNADIADLLKSALIVEGFEANVCLDAYLGIKAVHKWKPHLVILDLMMPAGGGFHVLENIKLSTHTRKIPIVVLTASKDSEHRKKALEKGVDAYLEKPYEDKTLISTIRKILKIPES